MVHGVLMKRRSINLKLPRVVCYCSAIDYWNELLAGIVQFNYLPLEAKSNVYRVMKYMQNYA